jgi:hypothetical protein
LIGKAFGLLTFWCGRLLEGKGIAEGERIAERKKISERKRIAEGKLLMGNCKQA